MKRIRGRRRQRERGWYLAGAVLATLLALGLLGSLQGRPAGAAAGKAKIPPAAYTGAGREEGSDGSWTLCRRGMRWSWWRWRGASRWTPAFTGP